MVESKERLDASIKRMVYTCTKISKLLSRCKHELSILKAKRMELYGRK